MPRTVLNSRQLAIMNECFSRNPRPDSLLIDHLGKVTGLTNKQVRAWFNSRRRGVREIRLNVQQLQELQSKFNEYRELGPLSVAQHIEIANKTGLSRCDIDLWVKVRLMNYNKRKNRLHQME